MKRESHISVKSQSSTNVTVSKGSHVDSYDHSFWSIHLPLFIKHLLWFSMFKKYRLRGIRDNQSLTSWNSLCSIPFKVSSRVIWSKTSSTEDLLRFRHFHRYRCLYTNILWSLETFSVYHLPENHMVWTMHFRQALLSGSILPSKQKNLNLALKTSHNFSQFKLALYLLVVWQHI